MTTLFHVTHNDTYTVVFLNIIMVVILYNEFFVNINTAAEKTSEPCPKLNRKGNGFNGSCFGNGNCFNGHYNSFCWYVIPINPTGIAKKIYQKGLL